MAWPKRYRQRGWPAASPQPVATASYPQFRGFKPYKPPAPPAGSFDPALDAQLRASQRGLGDVRQDVATANLRAGLDYGLDRGDLERQRTRGYADLDTQVTALQRSYQQLGRRQAEGARAANVLSGGIALQAARKRTENEAIERAPIETARTRLGEDTELALGRLDLGYQRDMIDRGQGLYRAEREGREFGLDIGEQKAFQAAQSGYLPPKPTNRVNKKGVAYREKRVGKFIYRYDRHGNVLSKRRA